MTVMPERICVEWKFVHGKFDKIIFVKEGELHENFAPAAPLHSDDLTTNLCTPDSTYDSQMDESSKKSSCMSLCSRLLHREEINEIHE